MQTRKFALGKTVITPGAAVAFEKSGESTSYYLTRHVTGDWGEIDTEDWEANNEALTPGQEQRVLSRYLIGDHPKTVIWIITEWDRSVTTILLPEEY